MIVVDTNILVYLHIQGEHTTDVEKLLIKDGIWIAPLLWRSEFKNVLALYLRKKIISLSHAVAITQQAEYLMAENEYQPCSDRVLTLVHASTCSAYDCEFVSLAEQFHVPLITQDKKILKEFPRYSLKLSAFLGSNVAPAHPGVYS